MGDVRIAGGRTRGISLDVVCRGGTEGDKTREGRVQSVPLTEGDRGRAHMFLLIHADRAALRVLGQ